MFLLGGLAICVYFLWLSGAGGIRTGFSHDDLMNTYRAWRETLPQLLKENVCFFLYPTSYRPAGGVFYHVLFEFFGFNALPYRLCLLLFLLANIYLAYAVARRLSGSREIAALTAVLHSYHVGFVPLYRNTGTCYDILCCFFYLAALLYYIRIRQQGRFLRPLEQLTFLGLFVLALNSKEIAVTLPLLIGIYEVLYHPPAAFRFARLLTWVVHEGRLMLWGGLFNAAFLIGKLYGPNGMARDVGQYRPKIRLSTLVHSIQHDLNEIFTTWGTTWLSVRLVVVLLLVLFLIAWRSKIPHFRFALFFWLTGILPVAFIPQRGIYAIYIPLLGFDLCVATLAIQARELLWRAGERLLHRTPTAAVPGQPKLRQIGTFALILLSLAWIYDFRGAHAPTWMDEQSVKIKAFTDQLRGELPQAKIAAHILFEKDPFANAYNSEWGTVFIAQLLYRDPRIEPDRLWKMPQPPDAQRMSQYEYVFTLDQDRLVLVSINGRAPPQKPVARTAEATPAWRAKPVLAILFGFLLTTIVSLALGLIAIDLLGLRFYRGERAVLAFVLGSVLLSNIVFLLAAAGWARKGVFFLLSGIILAVWSRVRRRAVPPMKTVSLPLAWKLMSFGILAAFSWYYISTAMAPEISSDGIAYHLGLVAQYAREHRLSRITTNLYASLSQGLEMLFLFAYSIGRHSAAAMVHCAFLFALPLLMVRYAQRYGMATAGFFGALLAFAAPVVGATGVIAYNDVAAAAVVFATFYLLQVWTDERNPALLAAAGLCAGFAYAIKYPLGIAVIYGVALICFRTGWHGRRQWLRSCGIFLLSASVSILPWMVKNWIYVRNPVAPFFNRYFPNPYMTVEFEEIMRSVLAHGNGLKLWEIPWEASVVGFRSVGLFGWVFLLAPLALLSLRKREGRQLLMAALVFALPVLSNNGARFLIPAIPFLALAMGMAFGRLPALAGVLVLAHAITSWPTLLIKYCHPYAWRLKEAPWEAALRIIPEERFLASQITEYSVSKMLERRVPADARTLSFERVAASYCAREVLIDWWGAENFRLRDTLFIPLSTAYHPMWRFTFQFNAQPLYGVRITQGAAGTDIWQIAELRFLHSGDDVTASPTWRLKSRPFPWNMDLAVDRRPITYWRADRELFPGMFFQVRFGGSRPVVDTVLLDQPHLETQERLQVEGEVEPGRWKRLAEGRQAPSPIPDFDLRRAATAEVLRSGIRYLLIPPNGYIRADVEKDPAAWNLVAIDESYGWRLYRIQ